MRSAVSNDTFFKIADNTLSDSDSSWEERARLIPFTEEAKITRERKIQTNPVIKNSNKTNFKCKQVKKKIATIGQLFEIQLLLGNFKNKITTF